MLVQFVIYDHPADFPRGYLVRAWFIHAKAAEAEPVPGPLVWPFKTLEAAREAIPYGLVKLPRFADDDAVIAEVWT